MNSEASEGVSGLASPSCIAISPGDGWRFQPHADTDRHARFQVDQHRIAETLVHERHSLVVRGNIGSLSKVSKHLNIPRQVFEWILALSLGGLGKEKQDAQRQKEFHGGNAIKPESRLENQIWLLNEPEALPQKCRADDQTLPC